MLPPGPTITCGTALNSSSSSSSSLSSGSTAVEYSATVAGTGLRTESGVETAAVDRLVDDLDLTAGTSERDGNLQNRHVLIDRDAHV